MVKRFLNITEAVYHFFLNEYFLFVSYKGYNNSDFVEYE